MSPTIYGRVMKIGTTGVGATDHNMFARTRQEPNLQAHCLREFHMLNVSPKGLPLGLCDEPDYLWSGEI